MTEMPDLLSPNDFQRFKSKDESWFLGAIGETIRNHCGWHVFPVISTVNYQATIGNQGIVMLPTMKLLSIDQVTYDAANVMTANMFRAYEAGYLQYLPLLGRNGRGLVVSVDFTHGYDTVPKAVAEVGFELTARTMEKPAGVVKSMTRGPTQMDFNEFGAVLSDDQKSRLGPYTLVRV